MARQKIFQVIAQVLLTTVSMIPIILCFGFLASDPQRFVHNVFVVGIYGLLIGLVSLVLSILN